MGAFKERLGQKVDPNPNTPGFGGLGFRVWGFGGLGFRVEVSVLRRSREAFLKHSSMEGTWKEQAFCRVYLA